MKELAIIGPIALICVISIIIITIRRRRFAKIKSACVEIYNDLGISGLMSKNYTILGKTIVIDKIDIKGSIKNIMMKNYQIRIIYNEKSRYVSLSRRKKNGALITKVRLSSSAQSVR